MSDTATKPVESEQLNIDPLRWFIETEQKRLNHMRKGILAKIADNWNLLTTFEVADFTEIVGMQAALVSLTQLMSWQGHNGITNEKIRDEWESMASRKLRQFNFVPSNSSQAVNNVRGYEGAFWARAIDELTWVS